MADPVARYLARRAQLEGWALEGAPAHPPRAVVVIPCLAERATLPWTLEDIAAQAPVARGEVHVVCVVNHRRLADGADTAHESDVLDNLQTLAMLREMHAAGAPWLGFIDAASPGRELPARGGVGLARKIGLDRGLDLMRGAAQGGVLVCLDADTRVDPGYLERILAFYETRRWAGLLPYAHPIPAGPEGEAILCYELFLRYHELGLRHAGSPYAFHTIGSTITCTGFAYAAVSGMNSRQAGEDFYFLQELAKTGPVERIAGPPVRPSARASHRVPFGTGRRVQRHLAGVQDEYVVYDPRIYGILKTFLHGVEREMAGAAPVLSVAREAAVPLAAFLEAQGFAQAWDRVTRQARSREQLLRQFHAWFDGFRTLKAIHYLRDHGYPMREMFGGIADLLGEDFRCGREQAVEVLARMRALCEQG
jgi:glycosyltransferase involved in cell wall biosynthesis